MEDSSSLSNSGEADRQNAMASPSRDDGGQQPKISLPKGGGAIHGMGEKFQVNPVTGTGSLSVPIAMSPGRAEFTPQLALSYDSGAGNGPFGLGWSIGLPSISRKTQKGIPRYVDHEERDVFLLSGAEDLVPVLSEQEDGSWKKVRLEDPEIVEIPDYTLYEGDRYIVYRYRPRIEGLFARIEKWTHPINGSTFWKSITKEKITTIYGQSDNAKIFHPKDRSKNDKRVFQWLIERTFDDKGNIIHYHYKEDKYTEKIKDNFPNTLAEDNRKSSNAFIQKYLKKVFYGNTKPYLSGGISHEEPDWGAWDGDNQWLFELVFDYGEHLPGEALEAGEVPTYEEQQAWPCRRDPFSSFRSSFDIRTYRLCRRVLMFHHFEKELEAKDYLVRSTDLKYDQNEMATKLIAVTHTSYRKKGRTYEKADLPPLKLIYSKAETRTKYPVLPLTIEDIETDYPVGKLINQNEAQFVDYDSNGITDILLKKNGGWYWAENKGNGQFAKLATVPDLPSLANQQHTAGQLVDIDGDGQLEYEVHSPQVKGYFARTEEGRWNKLRHFDNQPNINFQAPDLRRIDLTGDGIPDLLITKQDHLVYYPSEGKVGYGAAQRIAKALDETKGPQIVFSNPEQSIYLADMTGDGLTDIVRIRKDNICYWANMGYARFSPKVEMNNCPRFDTNDQFNQRYIKLADIDGSGTTDIIYLGGERIQFWHNEAGNSWSPPVPVEVSLPVDNLSKVQVVDLLGKGTPQLVWSSPTPVHQEMPLRYVDLMPEKPHLLIKIENNLGAETRLTYQPLTDFYLADKADGKPWIMKLPFPVHVLTRQETYDHISKNSFVTRYAYHHGYYDRAEREFRGFGMVEQWDTEDYQTLHKDEVYAPLGSNWSEQTDIDPAYTKTWFHTGYFFDRDRLSKRYAEEYYRVPKLDDEGKEREDEYGNMIYEDWLLDDTFLPEGLTAIEQREACRALKGQMLRQEVYADDRTAKAGLPYTVTEANYRIQCLQQRTDNRHAVFLVTPSENLAYHYEREPADPRIAHTANLAVDNFGNITHKATIVYPRRGTIHPAEQQRCYITAEEALFWNDGANAANFYRHSIPLEQRAFQLHGLDRNSKIDFAELAEILVVGRNPEDGTRIEEIDYAAEAVSLQKRRLQWSRTLYYDDALQECLPFKEVGTLAIPYQTYALAFTDIVLQQEELMSKITAEHLKTAGYLAQEQLALEGKFSEEEKEEYWWKPSKRALFDDPGACFYQPAGEADPFGNKTKWEYDTYCYTIVKTIDPLDNEKVVEAYDYRVLQPQKVVDENGVTTELNFDVRGMVMATAIRGNQDEGDSLGGFEANPLEGDAALILKQICEAPREYIGDATTWFYYDLGAFQREGQPTYALGLSREVHTSEADGEDSPVQIAITYSDGLGREILTKAQAEDGPAAAYDENGRIQLDSKGKPILAHTQNRWIGSGRVIYNNKGKEVQQYEPFFDSQPDFTENEALVKIGVTNTLHYDPLERVIRTDFPDGTHSKVEFTSWQQLNWDRIDTLTKQEEWYQERTEETGARISEIWQEVIAANQMERLLNAGKEGTPEDFRRCWKLKPFFEFDLENIIQEIMAAINAGHEDYLAQIEAWEENPFDPHLIARLRMVAYMKAIVMDYLDNLIAHGDHLFAQDTMETINEATQLYVLAAQILGRTPVAIQGKKPTDKRFVEIAAILDEFSNAQVELESQLGPTRHLNRPFPKLARRKDPARALERLLGTSIPTKEDGNNSGQLYFSIPRNDKFLGYWTTVADRLFKIRHCMNIEGVTRQLALFQPPIDPGMLVRARAAGLDLNTALRDLHTPLSRYRFSYMLQRALDFCNEVKSLGGALLAALEKKDAEALAQLRTGHEVSMLKAQEVIKENSLKETEESLKGLEESKEIIKHRFEYYKNKKFMNAEESNQKKLTYGAMAAQQVGMALQSIGAFLGLVPEFDTCVSGACSSPVVKSKFGGTNLKNNLDGSAAASLALASILRDFASLASIQGGYKRRAEEWDFQKEIAEKEEFQIGKQIAAAEIRKAIAEQDLKNHQKQIEQSQEAWDFMKDKYTNQALYIWMTTQLSWLYRGAYQLAYQLAKQAEQAFRFELDIEDSNYVQFGNWEDLKSGLIAGERLSLQLRSLEAAYLEKNRRSYELTKHLSLAQLNPEQLLQLKTDGTCNFDIPEVVFDLDHPGHYLRRIKSISLTIPCVTGPYTSVSAKLTLLKNRVRKDATLEDGENGYYYKGLEDNRFRHDLVGIQSIATSHANNDSGLFELNFRDERYLPFEGAGAISSWRLELPDEFRQFNYDTISDVILHMNYTARDGGDTFRNEVKGSIENQLNTLVNELTDKAVGLTRLFNLREDFPNTWKALGSASGEPTKINLNHAHFPFFLRDVNITIEKISLFFEPNKDGDGLPTEEDMKIGDWKVKTDSDGTLQGITFPKVPSDLTLPASSDELVLCILNNTFKGP